MDFDKLRKQVEESKRLLAERFGNESPDLNDICNRCNARYASHHEVGRIYCRDEFKEAFPHIADHS